MSEIGPSATAFFRILFALPLLWGWLGIEREKSPSARRPVNRNDYLWLASAGLFFTGDLAVWHWSLQFTSVANSTLLTNFAPIFVTLGARVLFAERISRVFVLGMLLALGGAVMLVGASFNLNVRHLFGDLLAIGTALFYAGYLLALAIGTALFYAGYLLAVKHLRHSFSSATIMAWSGLVSCPALLLIAVCSRENLLPATAGGWWVLIALALISHVGGQTLIAYAFGRLPASFSSVSLLLQPVVAAAVAWLVLNEPLSFPQALGGLVVLAGITLASQRGL